ncbi:hypothetical protein GCM10010124_19640 [Pilimelia terevasa]|uniref:Uncharacterized protein n=1 Tax=Pilimelia terevasa TaxID=53372 RepID=A0A8J3BPR1_9ACTN|nr:hypothetical protein [Pilimelia terevasa]GGK27048.1 hypothetical protein GCM10010124_19640 [Pilimelia terevasa]
MDKRAVAAVTTLAAMAGITVVAGSAPTPPAGRTVAPPGEAPPSAIARWRPLAAPVPAARAARRAQPAVGMPTDGVRYPVRRLPWSLRAATTAEVATAFPPRTVTGVCTDPARGAAGDPLSAARCGQIMWNNYRLTGTQTWLDQAVTQAEWLVARHRRHGDAWFHPRGAAGTYSGVVQGEALTLFARLAGTTAQPRWRTAAEATFAALLAPPQPGRPATSRVVGRRLWLDSSTDPAAALAGHLEALTGAYELWRVTADPRALRLLRAGLATVRGHVAGALPGTSAALAPHLLHLAHLTGLDVFSLLAARAWTGAPLADQRGTVVLRGTVTGWVLRGGRPVPAGSVRLARPAYPALGWRGPLPGATGTWLRVRGGPLRDRFVREDPRTAYVRGMLLPLDLHPAVTTALRPGTPLPRYDRGGLGAAVAHLGRRNVTLDRVATIDSTPYARLAPGQPYGGRWVALSGVSG